MWSVWFPLSFRQPLEGCLPVRLRWGKRRICLPILIAIVLTAAIIVSTGAGAVEEAAVRRQQNLTALRFYAGFAPVYFLENSGYELLDATHFTGIAGAQLRPGMPHRTRPSFSYGEILLQLNTWKACVASGRHFHLP
jgi:hypothetical protein